MLGESKLPKPFLKWAGGKTRMLKVLDEFLPKRCEYNKYIEPFIGGGALFFHINPEKALVNDLNQEVINVYKVIQDKEKLNRLMKRLDELDEHKTDMEFYYKKMRDISLDKLKGMSDFELAARTIFLNKTCFNGLYRVNSQDKFNVPFGKYKNPMLYENENLLACHEVLKKAEVSCGDYYILLEEVHKNDFVYLDPPYVPLSKTACFTSYTKEKFEKEDQKRLFKFCCSVDNKGAKFLLNNSDVDFIRNLYSKFYIISKKIGRPIAAKAASRAGVDELIIMNYKKGLEK